MADILCFHSSKSFLTLLFVTFSGVGVRNDLYKPFVNLIAEHMGNWYSVQEALVACFQIERLSSMACPVLHFSVLTTDTVAEIEAC